MSEQWRNIPGYEGEYAISDLGRIKRLKDSANNSWKADRILAPRAMENGYLRIMLCKNAAREEFLIHRLVLTVFRGGAPFSNAQVNHLNGDKKDNRPENLEWVTQSQNIKHAYDVLGHKARGVSNHSTHLTEEDIRQIRALRQAGTRSIVLARQFNISPRAIRDIVNRRTWAHVK